MFKFYLDQRDVGLAVESKMAAPNLRGPERTTIAGSLEIPQMINGLWQLAGGHNKNIEIDQASLCMDPLSVSSTNSVLSGADSKQNQSWHGVLRHGGSLWRCR